MSDEDAKRPHVPVAQRRAQLTEAAMEVMRRDGGWALTTRNVAEEAGLAVGAVHYAFRSKTELIASVFEADIESGATTIQAALGAGGTAREIIARAMEGWVAALREDRRTELVLQELTLMGVRDPELETLARDGVEHYRESLVDFLTRLADQVDQSWDAPVEMLAELVFSQFVGLAQNWMASGDDDLLDRCVADLVGQLARRLEPPQQ
jgi:AcrR family transcriptional regulator